MLGVDLLRQQGTVLRSRLAGLPLGYEICVVHTALYMFTAFTEHARLQKQSMYDHNRQADADGTESQMASNGIMAGSKADAGWYGVTGGKQWQGGR